MTPKVDPTGFEFLTCLTENTEWFPPENGTYRVTCFGKCADGGVGEVGQGDPYNTRKAGNGGNGGGSGGIARSLLELSSKNKFLCTVSASTSSFGNLLSATAALGKNPGVGSGGNEFNTTGGHGGDGGIGVIGPGAGKDGNDGENGGARGGLGTAYASPCVIPGAGGGGGGANYTIPIKIPANDTIRTKYTQESLQNFAGGNAGQSVGNGGIGMPTNATPYPLFTLDDPHLYGGGCGGAGATDTVTICPGTMGSPGAIIIEKVIY